LYVLVNPVKGELTPIIVQEGSAGKKEFTVPVEDIVETLAYSIHLRLTKKNKMETCPPSPCTGAIAKEIGEAYFLAR
jgi:hypothetical protein